MASIMHGSKTYEIDDQGFLMDFNAWDKSFAEYLASKGGIPDGLSEEHWSIIKYIRTFYIETGECPLVFQACRAADLKLRDFRRLFPQGYLRGACKLAGITYKEGYNGILPYPGPSRSTSQAAAEKTYLVNIRGFLVDPDSWDRDYATAKAHELKMPHGLTDRHWQVIDFLRNEFKRKGAVPTIYETCDAAGLEIDDLESLFPDGYHRGAVKLAGLKVR